MSNNPYLRRTGKRPKNAHGATSEKHLARRIGAKRTPNSGAGNTAKGDMDKVAGAYSFKIESKATVKESFSIKREQLAKIKEQAQLTGKIPIFTITFVTANGRPKVGGGWVLMPENLFAEVFK